jgi:hypothetical protein
MKAARWLRFGDGNSFLIGIAPSLLGPAGLLFLMLSSKSCLTRRSVVHLSLLVLAIALGLEFAQLFPRPGILEKVRYTFDWSDVIASAFSVGVASLGVLVTTPRNPPQATSGH